MHLCFRDPDISCKPPIPKAMKKNPRMISVSLRRGMAENTAVIRTLSPLTLEIVFKGLKTLNVLRFETLSSELVDSF